MVVTLSLIHIFMEGGVFKGYIDLLAMKAAEFLPKGQIKEIEIPAALQDEAASLREQMVEAAAGSDDDLMEKYFADGDLDQADLEKGLKMGIANGSVVPVLCVSALMDQGIGALMDFICKFMPNPAQHAPVKGTQVKGGAEIELTADPNGPFVAQVFKTIADLSLIHIFVKEVADGGQAYIVCPLVEQSETLEVHSAQELYRQLANGPLKEIALGCVHGKMRPAEKEAAISAFTVGEIKVLVATSVIEVGVNVPNASIMVIENAERFGLAQLHQLRGRVGRGNRQSYCFLMGGNLSQTARERLELLTQTQNGFELAQKDMELRGPGEYLGTQQHGTLDSQLLRLTQDLQEVYEVREIVEMLSSDANWRAEAELVFKAAMARHVKRLKSIAMN